MASISVSGVAVDFPLYHGSSRSLKKTVLAAASGRVGKDRQSRVVVQALRGINFELRTGDRLGLIGRNGAGKTTLLRVLAGIYEPVLGHVRIEGSLTALLDPNLGTNPELTGLENIRLRGLYDNLSKEATKRIEENVRSFSELGDFLHLPLRLYSTGMMVRLGFALATAIRPQVLLMDEWFMAGDASFMEKARERLESMVRGAEILVLSSHMMETVRAWCSRVIWLDQGKVRADGSPDEVLEQYLGYKLPPLPQPPPQADDTAVQE
ncbi:MAG: ABC transporter ATP-binding protein, partial [Acetobacteraceae bacterium]